MADKLAKNSLLEKGYKTYDDGSIYFVGFSGEDWKTIIECINEENSELTEENSEIINIDTSVIGDRQRMVVTDSKIELLLIVIQIAILMYRESSLCSFKK